MPWVKFVKEFAGNKIGWVVDVEDPVKADKLVKDKKVVRCLGPDGVIFEEAAPEDIQKLLDSEKKLRKAKKPKK